METTGKYLAAAVISVAAGYIVVTKVAGRDYTAKTALIDAVIGVAGFWVLQKGGIGALVGSVSS
jgi:hypothetical protein